MNCVEHMPYCRTPGGCAYLQDIREPRKMCMALDGSPSAVYALEWALANLMQLDKDELHLISVLIMAKHEKVRCSSAHGRMLACAPCQRAPVVMNMRASRAAAQLFVQDRRHEPLATCDLLQVPRCSARHAFPIPRGHCTSFS